MDLAITLASLHVNKHHGNEIIPENEVDCYKLTRILADSSIVNSTECWPDYHEVQGKRGTFPSNKKSSEYTKWPKYSWYEEHWTAWCERHHDKNEAAMLEPIVSSIRDI